MCDGEVSIYSTFEVFINFLQKRVKRVKDAIENLKTNCGIKHDQSNDIVRIRITPMRSQYTL